MNKILSLAILLLLPIKILASETTFMEQFYNGQNAKLLNVMAPCDPGCYVEIEIANNVFSVATSGVGWKRLYSLVDEKDNSVTVNYSQEKGVYVIHSGTNTMFSLNGTIENHPIDYALANCYSAPAGQTTMGMVFCLREAEETWGNELNRIYRMLGGASNEPLKSAHLAWTSYRDAQFNWFNSFLSSKKGSKWSYGIGERRVLLVRQEVEHLQSFYAGY